MKANANNVAPFAYELDAPVPRDERELVRRAGRKELNQSLNAELVWISFMVRNDEITICVCRERTLTWADVVFDLQRSVVRAYNVEMRGRTILHNMTAMPEIMGAPRYFAGLRSMQH